LTEIELRFTQENEELLRLGKKHATTRRTRHGRPGDTFRAAGDTWTISAVVPVPLRQAFATVFVIEGFHTPAEMAAAWQRCYQLLHPPDVTAIVYVHYFSRQLAG